MDEKIKELIAIGASVTGHCQPCLKYHMEQALNFGANTEEINTAISVGKMIEKGSLNAMDNFAKEQIEMLEGKTLNNNTINPMNSDNNCCCGDSGCC